MRSICIGVLLISVLALVATGCGAVYYKHQPTPYEVRTGFYTGPKGDVTDVNPAVLEHVLRQQCTNIPIYYGLIKKLLVTDGAKARASMWTAQSYNHAVADVQLMTAKLKAWKMLPEFPEGTTEEQQYAILTEAFAKGAAKLLVAPVRQALKTDGYASVTWGYKGNKDTGALSAIANYFIVTAHREPEIVRIHGSDPWKFMAVLKANNYDVSEFEDAAWDGNSKMTVDEAAAKVKAMDDSGQPIESEGEAAPAEGGEAAPAEGGEAAPAEGGEAAPAEGGETPAEGGE